MRVNKKAQISLIVMSIVSVFLYIFSLSRYPLPINFDFFIFIIFTIITESFVIDMSKVSAMSLSFGIILPVAVLFNPSAAIFCATLCILFSVYNKEGKLKHIFNIELYKTVANITNYIVSSCIASYFFIFLNNGLIVSNVYISMIFIFISVLLYIFCNITITSIYIYLFFQNTTFSTIYKNNFNGIIPNILGVSSISILIVLAYNTFGITAIIILLFPYLLIRYSFKLVSDMRETYLSTIKSLSFALEEKDPYTKGHSERVEYYSIALAKAIGINKINMQQLQYAAIFHDIGKIGISDTILNKPGKLTKEEFDLIKEHPAKGVKILQEVQFLKKAAKIIGAHHEYIDGSGYPQGLKGEEIPLESKIITIADIFDAVTTDRPYRKAMTEQQAIDIIKSESGRKLDPELVDKFVDIYNEGGLL